MKKKITLFLVALFLFLSSFHAVGDTVYAAPYEISVIYKYNNTVSAVDIIKSSDYTSDDDILIIISENEEGELVRACSVLLDKNLPSGVNEITIPNFEISDNHSVFVTIWDNLSSLIPLTDGTNPALTVENRVIGDEEDWLTSDNGKRIISYIGDENDIVIPNYVSNKHITTVAPLSSPDNMISIFGERASEITSISISDGIKIIGPTAFYSCNNASNTFDIPESVNYIGAYAFYGCEKMSGELNIPDGVEYIFPAAFAKCLNITSLTLPESIKAIGSYGFFSCSNISGELKIPEKVSRIEDYAFTYCGGLTGNLSLPDVKHIGDGVFAYCTNVSGNVTLTDATYIGDNAFLRCEKITGGLDLPNATHIGNGAFGGCSRLNGMLTLSDSLEYIGYSAFESCSFTGTLTLPESLVHIGDGAFNHCSKFTNEVLIIPKNVKTLGGDCRVDSNTYYSSHLFHNFARNKLKAFGVDPNNDYFCAKDGVLYNSEMTRLIAYPNGKTDETFEIPEGITQIDELSFGYCYNLKELTLPDSYVIEKRAPLNVPNQNGNTLAVALYNYIGIEKIKVYDSNPNYVSINGALYSKDGKTLWYCPVRIGESYRVEDGTERIETGAIYGVESRNLIKSFEIPESVNYIAPETIKVINYLFKDNISVDEKNTYFRVTDGILEVVE
ncbi:MAG: leucine-rich repeat domain-containing protein [Ruminococcaceae bacterium]|nr:leucine-rich repeat domain-containing protein [Oscillospiraceae bacterium]